MAGVDPARLKEYTGLMCALASEETAGPMI